MESKLSRELAHFVLCKALGKSFKCTCVVGSKLLLNLLQSSVVIYVLQFGLLNNYDALLKLV